MRDRWGGSGFFAGGVKGWTWVLGGVHVEGSSGRGGGRGGGSLVGKELGVGRKVVRTTV